MKTKKVIQEHRCSKCGMDRPEDEYMSRDGRMIYTSCKFCRYVDNKDKVKRYRDKKKQSIKINQDAQQPTKYSPKLIRRVLNYLYKHERYICPLCKKNPSKFYNTIYPYDKIRLYRAIQIWTEQSNQENWISVVELYQNAYHLCDIHIVFVGAGEHELEEDWLKHPAIIDVPMPTIEQLEEMDEFLRR